MGHPQRGLSCRCLVGGRGVKGQPWGPFDHKGLLGSQQAWHPEKADQDNREKDPGCRTIWLEALL